MAIRNGFRSALGASFAFASVAAAQGTAQGPQPPVWQQQATAAEQSGDFAQAISLYRAQLAQTPSAVPIQIALGRALRLAGKLDESRKEFTAILAANPTNVRAMLAMAVIETQAKNSDAANAWIGKAVAAGAVPFQLESPPELAALRETAQYKAHLQQATRFANPCRFEPEYSAFDFWIGDWDIYVSGQMIARNIVTREMNGCIIHERYQTANGAVRGESINYYDPQERRWKQNWVSAGGNVIAYVGNSPRDGVMELNGSSVSPGVPGTQLQRVVWERLPEGGLTQTVSTSNDNGTTWSPGFAGRYVRSKRPIQGVGPDDNYPINTALAPAAPPGAGSSGTR